MIVLGKDGDDKGTQLEHLTRDLLTRKGYTNITVSFISAGGAEIDVSADYVMPGFGSTQVKRLICECKAHERPMDITQWNKFLGKVFVEQMRHEQDIAGCFIALGGVNGNVAGSYDEVKRHRPDITLIDGDVLLEEVSKLYNLCPRTSVNDTLGRLTLRSVRSTDIVYYDSKAYWIALFENDAYTILDAAGQPLLDTATLDTLKPMIEKVQAANTFVDLPAEAEARRHSIAAQVALVAQLMLNDGATTLTATQQQVKEIIMFSDQDLEQAAAELKKINLVKHDQGSGDITFADFDPDPLIAASQYAEIYKFMLISKSEGSFDSRIFVRALGCPFYDTHIDENLVTHMQKTQGELPLAAEDIQEVLRLCRLSPSALVNALVPYFLVEKHRREAMEEGRAPDAKQDLWDRNVFLNLLYNCVSEDFPRVALRSYFYEKRQVTEIERTQKVSIKSKSGIELEGNLHERHGIGHLVDGLSAPDGGPFIYLLLAHEAPQPWEMPTPQSTPSDGVIPGGATEADDV